jgi:hypothetical protein
LGQPPRTGGTQSFYFVLFPGTRKVEIVFTLFLGLNGASFWEEIRPWLREKVPK